MPIAKRGSGSPKSRRVVGIGGIFIRAANARSLSKWYADHLGIEIRENMALYSWANTRSRKRGQTVWSLFENDSDYFPKDRQFMVNYRVKNLSGVLDKLKSEGVRVEGKVEDTSYGRFGWVYDPDGNKVELWEPPLRSKPADNEIQME